MDEDQVSRGEDHQADNESRGKSPHFAAPRGCPNRRRGLCRRSRRHLCCEWVRDNVRRESIPVLRDGFDPRGCPIAKCLPQRRNLEREVRVLDEGIGPQCRHQLLFGERAPRAPDQQQQQVEGLRRQRYALVLTRQDALTCVQTTRPELVQIIVGAAHWTLLRNSFENPSTELAAFKGLAHEPPRTIGS